MHNLIWKVFPKHGLVKWLLWLTDLNRRNWPVFCTLRSPRLPAVEKSWYGQLEPQYVRRPSEMHTWPYLTWPGWLCGLETCCFCISISLCIVLGWAILCWAEVRGCPRHLPGCFTSWPLSDLSHDRAIVLSGEDSRHVFHWSLNSKLNLIGFK